MERLAVLLGGIGVVAGCGQDADPPAAPPEPTAPAAAAVTDPAPPLPAESCAETVLHLQDGQVRGTICRDRAAGLGLTVIDLSEDWTPALFAPGPEGQAPRYRERYLALAHGREKVRGPAGADSDALALYGIFPTLPVLRERLAEADRHACHDAVDDAAIGRVRRDQHELDNLAAARRRSLLAGSRAYTRGMLRRHRQPDLDALAAAVPRLRGAIAYHRRLQDEQDAMRAVQRHLLCDGLLEARYIDGVLGWRTAEALDRYQKLHFLRPTESLDAETRAAMLEDPRELDFRAALRTLRERVVDATGLIEDGSAGNATLPVLGRHLEPESMRVVPGHAPLPDAAPDLIAPATEAAARHLGWRGPAEVIAFVDRHPQPTLRVAVALPPPPDYHAPHMQLRAVIDRGDVWYDVRRRWRPVERRPVLTLYARVGERRIALVRWPTTIGGWNKELRNGWVQWRYKDSEVGPRVWREMYAAPTWVPLASTPDRDLVRRTWKPGRRWELRADTLGPSPRSAYGLVMMVHHQKVVRRGQLRWDDNQIRTHGSSNVPSIAAGHSHGCHRLLNHLAVRLGTFVLNHRAHERRGEVPSRYRRIVRQGGQRFVARLDSRGYLFELTPPVPVDVLPGRILSRRKRPPR